MLICTVYALVQVKRIQFKVAPNPARERSISLLDDFDPDGKYIQ